MKVFGLGLALALILAGCPSTAPHQEQLMELARGQQPRTEEALEAQKRCEVGSADPVACKAVSATLQADRDIFQVIINGRAK